MNYSFVEYSSCSHAAKLILQNKLYVTDPPPGMMSNMKFCCEITGLSLFHSAVLVMDEDENYIAAGILCDEYCQIFVKPTYRNNKIATNIIKWFRKDNKITNQLYKDKPIRVV